MVAPRAASTSSNANVANIMWKTQTDGSHRNRNQRVTLADSSESGRQEIQEVFNDLANGAGTTDGALYSAISLQRNSETKSRQLELVRHY